MGPGRPPRHPYNWPVRSPNVSTPWSVLTANRDFRRLFTAELVMFGGDWLVMVPLQGLLLTLTHNGFLGGVALAADTGIQALLLPYAGVVADRHDRRHILICSNAAAFGAVLLLLWVRTPGSAWLGPVAIGAVAVAKAFYSPAATAALPNLVEPADLSAANAVSGSAWGTMTVVGSSVGGLLAARFTPYTCFVITAGLLAVAAALALGVRRPMQAEREPERVDTYHALREAAGYIAHKPRVAALVTVKSAVGLGNGVLALFTVLATGVFMVGATGSGLLFAARGAGALIGPFLLRRVVRDRRLLLPALAGSMALYGVAYLGVSVTPWFVPVLGLVVIAHIAGGGNWAMSNLALQEVVADRLRGRVFATDQTIAMLAIAVSTLTVGALDGHLPARMLVAISGGVTLAYGVGWGLVTRRLRLTSEDGSSRAASPEARTGATAPEARALQGAD
jgi:MFS family permease